MNGYILYTEYDEYGNEVEVYFYRSNPNKFDSDGDGFSDLEDPYPMEFNTVITGCSEEGIVSFNTGKSFIIRFSEAYTVDEFIDDYRTRYLSFSKKTLESIQRGLNYTEGYNLSFDELVLMGYVDEGQMRYLMQEKNFSDKYKAFVALTGAEYLPTEKCFFILGDENTMSRICSIKDILNYFKLSGKAATWLRYFAVTIKQAILGNYSDEVNAVGIAAEFGLAFTGVDVYMDLRDLSYDLTHFDASWEWLGSFALDSVSLLPILGALVKSDRMAVFAKHADNLFEMRRFVKVRETIADMATQVKNSWKQLERSAAAAYNYIKDKVVYNAFMKVMDNLKQSGLRPQLAVAGYNNVFIEVFADSGDVMKEMADLPLTQAQKVFRETVMASTDSSGKVVKSTYEIEKIAKTEAKALKEAIESGIKSKVYKEGFDNHLINGTLGSGSKGVVGGHNFDSFKQVLTEAGFDIDDCIINVKTHPTIDGIYEIDYRIPARQYGATGEITNFYPVLE